MTSDAYTRGSLVKRHGSPYWYLRYTTPGGKRIFRTTKCIDFNDARMYAERVLKIESGVAGDFWKAHVKTAMADSKSWLRETIRKSRSRNMGKSRLKASDIEAIALRSNGYCELTGVPFSLENPTSANVAPFKPSLDRIDSSEGYCYRNCRMIIVAANLALRDWGDDVFKTMCIGYATRLLEQQLHKSDENYVTPIVAQRVTKTS